MKKRIQLLTLALLALVAMVATPAKAQDFPFYVADLTGGAGFPTATKYAWYDAGQMLTNFAGTYPPADIDKLGTWGVYRGNMGHLVASRGGGGLVDPWYLATGNKTNGPAIRNADFNNTYRQFSQNPSSWNGGGTIPQPFTFFMVFKKIANNPNGEETLMRSEQGTGGTLLYIKVNGSGGRLSMFAGSTIQGASSSIALNTWYLLTAQFNGASSFMRLNGVLHASGDAGTTAIEGLSMGMSDNFSVLIGDYSDAVFYSRALDAGEITTIETALAPRH